MTIMREEGHKINQLKIQHAVADLLTAVLPQREGKFWVDDDNFRNTPKRVAQAWVLHWGAGYFQDPRDILTTFPNEYEKDLVIVKDIDFYSTCAHHLAPFFGKAAIAYVPGSKVCGLSKLARVLDVYARRLQLQEHITGQTADTLMDILDPKGVMVILYNVTHTCMSSRGVEKAHAVTTTSAIRGIFRDVEALRSETLALINQK